MGVIPRGLLVGERRACAAAALSFFMMLFLMNALVAPPAFAPLFYALTVTYTITFAGVVAGWFWARWFATGIGISGLILAGMLAWQIGLDPVVFMWGGAHLAVVLGMLGDGAASFYDARTDWRERWKVDENGANRLGKAIMRAGTSLPYLIMAGLAPRESGSELTMLLAIGAVGFAAVGVNALVRMRTWGVFMLGAAAVAGAIGFAPLAGLAFPTLLGPALVATAVLPFVGPMAQWVVRRV
jgi:hypothetical protein